MRLRVSENCPMDLIGGEFTTPEKNYLVKKARANVLWIIKQQKKESLQAIRNMKTFENFAPKFKSARQSKFIKVNSIAQKVPFLLLKLVVDEGRKANRAFEQCDKSS